jgi:hypothetical protein
MKYIECPKNYDYSNKTVKSLFVAGGISGCSNWQKEFIKSFEECDIVLINPRRNNFSLTDLSMTQDQIFWEHKNLFQVDATSFWFTSETLCPITLFELGKQAMLNKPLFVGVHPNYARKIDIELQLKLLRPEVVIVYDLDSLAGQIKDWLKNNNFKK